MSDVVTDLLAQRGLRLAVIETTTRGELSQRLSEAARGVEVLAGNTMVLSGEALCRALDVPGSVIDEFGFPSQQVADAAAQAVREAHNADLGLALVGPADPAAEPPIYFSLSLGDQVLRASSRQGRAGPAGRGWLMYTAMDLVRRHLLGLPIR
jgi:nicotinamide mononucleotide (NMN) deamidase PncC